MRRPGRSVIALGCAISLTALFAAPDLLPLAYEDARARAIDDIGGAPVRFEIHQRRRAPWLPVPAERIVAVDRATFIARCADARPAASAAPLDRSVRAELLFLFDGRRGDPLWTAARVERFEARIEDSR